MTWQDEISSEEWKDWQNIARKLSKSKRIHTTLGADDYAAAAIEKLLEQSERPPNVPAWLATTIRNQYIDRFRKIQARGGPSKREMSNEEWEEEMVAFAVGSPSVKLYLHDSVEEVLNVLNPKEKELLILSTAGYDNHQIALHLGYASNKAVATRLQQIKAKVNKSFQKSVERRKSAGPTD